MFRILQKPGKCLCVSVHRPSMMEYHWHHIWPLADGGPDEAWNKVKVCPTTHANIHKIYRRFKASYMVTLRLPGEPKYAYNLARYGYDLYRASQG